MNVPSYEFLAFVAVMAIIINVSATPSWRRGVLFAANVSFILTFTHDPTSLAPFAFMIGLGYVSVKVVERYKNRAMFAALLLVAVLAFCWLKRYGFMPNSLLLPFSYFMVGMSYVFFRIMHLIIDAHQDVLPERLGILSYLNYTLNFVALVSGPIQLYRDYRRTESDKPILLDMPCIGRALERIVVGLFKLTIVSPVLYYGQERCIALFLQPGIALDQRIFLAGFILAIFPAYLYANFAGYTDFVIGAAAFLRLELPENFDKPFTSKGAIEFFGRWHMTLSNWVKTYVYFPLLLGLMRRFPWRRMESFFGVAAYFGAFFVVGVWHGRTSMFLFLGVLFGAGVSANKFYQIAMTRRLGRTRYRALCDNSIYAALSRGLTFVWWAFSCLWFWSSWSQLAQFVSALGPVGTIVALLAVFVSASLVLSAQENIERILAFLTNGNGKGKVVSSPYFRSAWCTALVVLTLSIALVLKTPAPHVVYRAF